MMLEKTEFQELPVKVEFLNISSIPLHAHEDLQIMMVLEGTVELFLALKTYIVHEGQIQFIQMSDIHKMTADKDNIVLLVTINTEFANKIYPMIDHLIFTTRFEEDSIAKVHEKQLLYSSILNVVQKFFDHNEKNRKSIINSTEDLLDVLYKHFRGFKHTNLNKGFQYSSFNDSIQVDRVSDIIAEVYRRYQEKLSLTEIAERNHLSVYYISHIFQQSTGLSFRDFVSMVRVEKALNPMLSTDLSLTKISFDVGFSHYSFFKKNFLKWYESGPEEIRAKFKDQTILKKTMNADDLNYENIKSQLFKLCGHIDDPGEELVVIDLDLANIVYKSEEQISVRLNISTDDMISYEYGELLNAARLWNSQNSLNQIIQLREDIDGKKDKTHINFAKIYKNYDFNFSLNELYKCNETVDLQLYDDDNGKKGIFTKNGLYKPAYFMLIYSMKLFSEKISIREGLVSNMGNDYRLLLFNKSRYYPKEISLKLNEKLDYICSIEYIESQNSAIWAWNRLNFIDLNEELKEKVNQTTQPRKEIFYLEKSTKERVITMYPNTISMIDLRVTE